MRAATILIADDDRSIRTVLSQALGRIGHDVRTTGTAANLWRWVSDGEGDLVITDVVMPDENGLDLIPRIRKIRPDLRIIVMSAQNTLLTAVRATERGAFEYLPKPFDLKEVVEVVQRALAEKDTKRDTVSPQFEPEEEALPLIGRSAAMQDIYRVLARLMNTDLTVMVTGESGTGKELVARALHDYGKRRFGPFVAINMAAIPRELIESELFGHEKGSFTGATEKRQGYFESVNGGTIFLDEVGELPLGTQARLLRILENGEFIKVGSSKVQKTDVRVVAATNRNLLDRAQQGKFREDLYYRLATVPIRVPKLSERKEDIPLLFKKFSSDFAENNHREMLDLSPGAQTLLENYPWPGNIRQLKNISEQICVLENGNWISEEALKHYLPPAVNQLPMLLEKTAEGNYDGMSERDVFYKVLIDLRRDVNDLKKVVFGLIDSQDGSQVPIPTNLKQENSGFRNYPVSEDSRFLQTPAHTSNELNSYPHSNEDEDDFIDAETYGIEESNDLSLESKEIELIRLALSKNNGKRKKAAEDLGISERTLYRKIKQYELD